MLLPERVIAVLMLSVAACLLLLGGAMTSAGVSKIRAEAFMSHWAKERLEPDTVAWEVARKAAAASVEYYPVANGEYEDRLGRMYLWRHYKHPFGAKVAQGSRILAMNAFGRALDARTISPNTHARLASTHLYMLRMSDAFFRHIEIARAQGPWVVEVNREIAEVGFMAWPSLTMESKKNALDAFCAALLTDDLSGTDLLILAARVGESKSSCLSGRLVHEI